MQKRTIKDDSGNAFCGSMQEGQARYNWGARTMRDVAEKAGARIQIGRMVRYNFKKIDNYLDSISGQGGRSHEE